MNPEFTKVMPGLFLSDIFGEKDGHTGGEIWILPEGAREQARTRGIQNVEVPAKQRGYPIHHWLHPIRVLLSANAVFDDGLQKRMSGCCPESVIADLPIHPVALAQTGIEGEFLKRKNTVMLKKGSERPPKEYIQIEIETTVMIDGEVTEKIVTLDGPKKGVEHGPIVGKMLGDEPLYFLVIKKEELPVRM